MRYFSFKKLVRDKILPSMIEGKQIAHGVRRLDDKEFLTELITKVKEESQELFAAQGNPDEVLIELADVYEVLNYIKKHLHISDSQLEEAMDKKIEKRGAFDERTYIEYVEVTDDNPWIKYYNNQSDKYPEIQKPD